MGVLNAAGLPAVIGSLAAIFLYLAEGTFIPIPQARAS